MPGGWHRGHRIPPVGPLGTQDDGDLSLIPASQPQPPVPPQSNVDRPAECINKYPTPAFALLCTMMDRLRSEEASKRRDTLSRFMDLWRVKVGNDLCPLIRLLLPDVSVDGCRISDQLERSGASSLQPKRSHVGEVLYRGPGVG
jgi:DNA ligase-4